MAVTLSSIAPKAVFSAILNNAIDGSARPAATRKHGKTYKPNTTLANGAGANQADRVWEDTARDLTSGNSENIDLYDFGTLDIGAGAGLDALGQSLALAEIVEILVYNSHDSDGDLVIGAEGSGAAWSAYNGSDSVQITTLSPGAWWHHFDPTDGALPVADSTNHLLKMAASGGDVEYNIHILGRSA